MHQEDLISELLKFSPAEAEAVYRLGTTLEQGSEPPPEEISEAVFTLEQFAAHYPAYSEVYLGLVEAIHSQLLVGAQNPGRFCDEVENPGPESAIEELAEKSSDAPRAGVPRKGQEHAELDDGGIFDLETCDHGTVPVDRAQDQMLEDEGPIPPPYARHVATFGGLDLPPEWSDERILATEAQFEALSLATNPPKGIEDLFPPEWRGMVPSYLLGSNPKLAKGGEKCYLSAGLSLSPWTNAGVGNLCPYASKGCQLGCLNISGQAEMQAGSKKNIRQTIREARIRRTKLLFGGHPEQKGRDILSTRGAWLKYLEFEIARWKALAARDSNTWGKSLKKILHWHPGDPCSMNYKMSLRMNVLSDIVWESDRMAFEWDDEQKATVIDRHPEIQFYDYTKNPVRMKAFLEGRFPKNYYLTFSWSEINAEFAFWVLDHNGCVAMPFDTTAKQPLPDMFCGYPVINADEHDFRFMDRIDNDDLMIEYGTGLIAGLHLKGQKTRREFKAAKALEREKNLPRGALTGGFCQYAEDAGAPRKRGKKWAFPDNITNRPDYKQMLIEESRKRREAQARENIIAAPKGWKP